MYSCAQITIYDHTWELEEVRIWNGLVNHSWIYCSLKLKNQKTQFSFVGYVPNQCKAVYHHLLGGKNVRW